MTNVEAELDWHEQRRRQAIPTVSVLLGATAATGSLAWRRWATHQQRPVVVLSDPATAARGWLLAAAHQHDLSSMALTYLACRLGREPAKFLAAWLNKTSYDRQQFWDAWPFQSPSPLVRCLCDLAASTSTSSGQLIDDVLGATAIDPFAAVEQLLALLADAHQTSRAPAILLQPASSQSDLGWLQATAEEAARWVLRVPQLSTAIAVPDSLWLQLLAASPPSRTRDLLREGVVAVTTPSPDEIASRLQQAKASPEVLPAARVLAQHGADAAMVETACSLLQAAGEETEHASNQARSNAERFLYEFLQLLPETAGRWELNATLPFNFGPRPIEVDLLERSRRLVVEIDGYYHFRNRDVYRRDRAKDYLLQRHGYFVLRFLAEDVVFCIEQIRDRILEVYRLLSTRTES